MTKLFYNNFFEFFNYIYLTMTDKTEWGGILWWEQKKITIFYKSNVNFFDHKEWIKNIQSIR